MFRVFVKSERFNVGVTTTLSAKANQNPTPAFNEFRPTVVVPPSMESTSALTMAKISPMKKYFTLGANEIDVAEPIPKPQFPPIDKPSLMK
jgi:hypothetical protein